MSLLFAHLEPLHPQTQRQLLSPLAHDYRHQPGAVTAVDDASRSSSGETSCGDAPLLAPNAWAHGTFVDPLRRPQRLSCDDWRRS